MKVIHLPSSVAGNSWGLSRGERQLGLHSDVLVLHDRWFEYPADRYIFTRKPATLFGKMLTKVYLPHLLREMHRVADSYDVFHFNYGTSIIDLWMFGLPLLDLPVYKKSGKIIVTFNGCDARQKYRTIERTVLSACHNQCHALCNLGIMDHVNRKKIQKFDAYADAIFSLNPDLMYFLPERARFLPYTIPSWDDIQPVKTGNIVKKIKIVHAPTSRIIKGTRYITEAIDEIKRNYGDVVELSLVENVPHKKALEQYREAHVAIDQLLVGFYGGFAVEVMKMGIPVIAYLREEDLRFLPENMAHDCRDAIIQTDPSTLYDTLCTLIENPSLLQRRQEASLEYVHRWHDPVRVAEITKSAYET